MNLKTDENPFWRIRKLDWLYITALILFATGALYGHFIEGGHWDKEQWSIGAICTKVALMAMLVLLLYSVYKQRRR